MQNCVEYLLVEAEEEDTDHQGECGDNQQAEGFIFQNSHRCNPRVPSSISNWHQTVGKVRCYITFNIS